MLQSFYDGMVRNAQGYESSAAFREHIHANTGTMERQNGLKVAKYSITSSTRASFWAGFGMVPDHQKQLERRYDQILIKELVDCVPVDLDAYQQWCSGVNNTIFEL